MVVTKQREVMEYLNGKKVVLTWWATKVPLRNKPEHNVIQFVAQDDIEIKVGDVILGTMSSTPKSEYHILEILGRMEAKVPGYKKYKALTKWVGQ